jgi:hypothetical protein
MAEAPKKYSEPFPWVMVVACIVAVFAVFGHLGLGVTLVVLVPIVILLFPVLIVAVPAFVLFVAAFVVVFVRESIRTLRQQRQE